LRNPSKKKVLREQNLWPSYYISSLLPLSHSWSRLFVDIMSVNSTWIDTTLPKHRTKFSMFKNLHLMYRMFLPYMTWNYCMVQRYKDCRTVQGWWARHSPSPYQTYFFGLETCSEFSSVQFSTYWTMYIFILSKEVHSLKNIIWI